MAKGEETNRYNARAIELSTLAAQAESTLREILLEVAEDYTRLTVSTSIVESDRIRKRLMCFEVGAVSSVMLRMRG
jgi:hypothetical protein